MEKPDMETNTFLEEATELPQFEDKHIISATYTKSGIALSDPREYGFAKMDLHQFCVQNRWNLVYKCIKEEGPEHMKRFTFEVEIKTEDHQILGIGAPCSKKKIAAESAAERAMCCLQDMGYVA